MHVRSSLSTNCILSGKNETFGCWGNDALQNFINEAHKRGLKVILDVVCFIIYFKKIYNSLF